MRISLNQYGSKLRKVSSSRPTVPNETILETKQEFFFTKVAPVQSIIGIALLGFWLILFPWNFLFILHYHLFFVNNILFGCLYFSEYDIRMFLFVFWLRNRPSIKYVRKWRNWGWGGSHPKCVKMRTGGGVEKSVIRYVRTKWMDANKCCGIFFVRWFGQVH